MSAAAPRKGDSASPSRPLPKVLREPCSEPQFWRRGDVTPLSRVLQAFGRHMRFETMPVRHHMLWSVLSCSTSPTNRMTVLLPRFCHQCEVPLVSGRISPALCTMGTEQLLAYSTISPSAM